VTVNLVDDAGNPVSGAASSLKMLTKDDLGGGGISQFVENKKIPGRYTATVNSTLVGNKLFSVTFENKTIQPKRPERAAAVFYAL
jgi:hypothetical protein